VTLGVPGGCREGAVRRHATYQWQLGWPKQKERLPGWAGYWGKSRVGRWFADGFKKENRMDCFAGWAESTKRIGKLFSNFWWLVWNGFKGYLNLNESF
jgi:hypothetical protein